VVWQNLDLTPTLLQNTAAFRCQDNNTFSTIKQIHRLLVVVFVSKTVQ
jgi:hypothetical protein